MFLIIVLLLTGVIWISAGCNRHSRYRVLSTLFDGVPVPEQVAAGQAVPQGEFGHEEMGQEGGVIPANIRYRHPATGTESECVLCHGNPRSLVIPGKDMCLQCHKKVKEKRKFIHGPAVLDCIICHDPHEGKSEDLLRTMGNDLCYTCHYRKDKEDAFKTEAHKESKGESFICLNCHDPHGGQDKFFVRTKVQIEQSNILEKNIRGMPNPATEIQDEISGQENIETDIKP